MNLKNGKLIEFQKKNEVAETFMKNFNHYNNDKIAIKPKLQKSDTNSFFFKVDNIKIFNKNQTESISNIQNIDDDTSSKIKDDLDEELNIYSSYQTQANNILNEIKQNKNIFYQKEQFKNKLNNELYNNPLNNNFVDDINGKEEQKVEGIRKEKIKDQDIEEDGKKKESKKIFEKTEKEKKIVENDEHKKMYQIKKENSDFDFPFACNYPLVSNKNYHKENNDDNLMC